jgi:hypothetical protein
LDYKEGGVIMDRQEIINNIGYIADKKAKEYVEQRKSHGVNDPYMLNEIEEAYYEGMVQSENFWRPASEHPPVDKETGLSVEVIGIQDRLCEGERVIYTRIVGSGWKHDNIKWWCYQPKEE